MRIHLDSTYRPEPQVWLHVKTCGGRVWAARVARVVAEDFIRCVSTSRYPVTAQILPNRPAMRPGVLYRSY
jgi:hypothetical protein